MMTTFLWMVVLSLAVNLFFISWRFLKQEQALMRIEKDHKTIWQWSEESTSNMQKVLDENHALQSKVKKILIQMGIQ